MNLMLFNIDTQTPCTRPCGRPCKGLEEKKKPVWEVHQYAKDDAAKAPSADAQWHNSDGQSEGLQRENSSGGGGEYKGRWKKNDIKYEGAVEGFQLEVQVGSEKRRVQKKKKKKKEEETERLSVLCRFLSQAPAPLAETKWLAGIWCNLHLSAKSWILFLQSRCWRARRKAQLTGPHSWDRCL